MSPSPEPSPARRDGRALDDWRGAWKGLDHSSVMGVEIMAGILAWGAIGYLLDGWLGTTPWLFGIGTMLGFAGGLTLVYIRSSRMEGSEGWAPPTPRLPATAEDDGRDG